MRTTLILYSRFWIQIFTPYQVLIVCPLESFLNLLYLLFEAFFVIHLYDLPLVLLLEI